VFLRGGEVCLREGSALVWEEGGRDRTRRGFAVGQSAVGRALRRDTSAREPAADKHIPKPSKRLCTPTLLTPIPPSPS